MIREAIKIDLSSNIEKKKTKLFRIQTSKNGFMKPFFDLTLK
jgi:hypothetical protein